MRITWRGNVKLLTSSVGMSKWFLSEDGFFGQEIQLQYLVYWIVSMQTALGEGVCVLQWTADLSLSISDCWDRRGGGGVNWIPVRQRRPCSA